MALIDVGADPINRAAVWDGTNWTIIGLDNPANNTGVITQIQIWVNTAMTGLRIGTFYFVAGNDYKCRDSVSIGALGAGLQTLNAPGDFAPISVVAGDLLGMLLATGSIERDFAGFAGLLTYNGEAIDPGDQATYGLESNDAVSLYGTGVSPWSGTISGVTNPTSIMGIAVADIASVKGVASS